MGKYSVLAVKMLHDAEFCNVTSGGTVHIPLHCKRLMQFARGRGTVLHSEYNTKQHTLCWPSAERAVRTVAIVVKVKPSILFQELL